MGREASSEGTAQLTPDGAMFAPIGRLGNAGTGIAELLLGTAQSNHEEGVVKFVTLVEALEDGDCDCEEVVGIRLN